MKKHISYRSSQLLTTLIEQGKDFFTLSEARNILSGNKRESVKKLLSEMAKRGLIMRIKEGLYHRIPYEQNAGEYFPNWHRTAEAMVQPSEYYIGLYSALDILGLVTQPSMVEQVVTKKQIKPKMQCVKNVRFEFITFSEKRFFGYKKHWIDNFYKVYSSDLEKTLLDCLYKPDYSGGITEITKALYKSQAKLGTEKFKEYLVKYDTQVVYKRLGFIIDQLNLLPDLQGFISTKITSSYAPLSPVLPKTGHYNLQWRIIDNCEFTTSLDSIMT